MAKVLKADCSSGSEAYVYKTFAEQTDAWFTIEVWVQQATLDIYPPDFDASGSLIHVLDDTNEIANAYYLGDGSDTFLEWSWGPAFHDEPPLACTWQVLEVHVVGEAPLDFYVDGALVASSNTNLDALVKPDRIYVGQRFGYLADPASVVYVDNVKVGTTRGGSEIFSDDFESGTLAAWDSTSGDVSVVDEPTCDTALPDGTVTVTKVGGGTGTVTSSPAGINCGGDCSQFYAGGTEVTLSAAADPGSTFIGWESGGCTGTADCVFEVNGDKAVTARFEAFVTDNTTCAAAATITGTSGSVIADNTAANDFDFATDPLFNDDCFGWGYGGGGPLWWKYTNPFSRAVMLRIRVQEAPSDTIERALYAIFRGPCGAHTRDLYPTSENLRTIVGYSRDDSSVPTDSGDYIEAAVAPGETVYVEVDGWSGDATDPVVLPASPNRGRYTFRWSVLTITTRDAVEESVEVAEDNCAVAGDSYVEPTSVVQGASSASLLQTAHAEDYVEFNGDSWYTSAWDAESFPDAVVHRWDGAAAVSYVLPVSGVWEQTAIQLNTDGVSLWAVTTENGGPTGSGWPNPRAGHPDEPAYWQPAYPVVFQYDPGLDDFVVAGRMTPRTANVFSIVALGTGADQGRVGSIDSTAHESMPGRCYVAWNEKGADGIGLTHPDFDDTGNWIEHFAVGCFGSGAPFAEFDVGLSTTPIATAEGNNFVNDIDAGPTSPVGDLPYYLPRIGRVLLTNDQGVCQLYRMEAQVPDTITPYQQGHVLCEQVEDGGTLTSMLTIEYEEPPGAGIEDLTGLAGLGNTGYANHMSIEPECHAERPLDSAIAWGFVRQGDAFPGNHPDFTILAALGVSGVLWRDTDPDAADGIFATRNAGFRAGVWTVAGSGQSAASFAAQADDAATTFSPDLLVLDVEVYYGTDPSAAWTWHDDMVAAFRGLQPGLPAAVTMGPLKDDFNYAAYTAGNLEVWPQSYGALLSDHFDPVEVFDRVVANGVDPAVVAPVLAAPSYPADVDELAVAGHLKWSVFTLDDRPVAPTVPSVAEVNTLRTLLVGWVLGNTSSPAVPQTGRGFAYNLDPLLAAPERWYNDNAQANGNDVFVNMPLASAKIPNGGGGGRRTLHRDRYGETWGFGSNAISGQATFYDRFCDRAWVSTALPYQDASATAFTGRSRMSTGRQVAWEEPDDIVRSVTVYRADPDASHHPWFAAVSHMKILRKWIICDVGDEIGDELGEPGFPFLNITFRALASGASPASIAAFPAVILDSIEFR